MSKKSIRLLIIIVFILIVSTFGVFEITKKIVSDSNKEAATQKMTDDEKRFLNLYRLGNYEVVSRDATGKIASYRFLNLREEGAVTLEWMTDEEKVQKELGVDARVQILERDSAGKIVTYKIVINDSDIISKY